MDMPDIARLGTLARIAMTPEEMAAFQKEIPAILDYVSSINAIAADGVTTKQVGARYNVWREDVVTTQPDQYTDVLLAAAPKREGRFFKVKKILSQD